MISRSLSVNLTILSCNLQVFGVRCFNVSVPCEHLVLSLGVDPMLLCLVQAYSILPSFCIKHGRLPQFFLFSEITL